MTTVIDATKPLDSELVSMLPWWIRQTRSYIADAYSGVITFTNLVIQTTGNKILVCGTDIEQVAYEIISVDSLGAVNISRITNTIEGVIKVFYFTNSDVTVANSEVASGGNILLNQPVTEALFEPEAGDVLCLLNINGSTLDAGYWRELYRTLNAR